MLGKFCLNSELLHAALEKYFLIITNRQELLFNEPARNSGLTTCIFMTLDTKQQVDCSKQA
jgi:hypothetical protein